MLVLASGSPTRRAMLEAAGVSFQVEAADIDESALLAGLPQVGRDCALQLAKAKALAVAERRREAMVLGADSILEAPSGELWQKATDIAELRWQLRALRGQTHNLHTAVAGVRHGRVVWQHAESARLSVRDFSDDWLDGYMAACGEAMLGSVGGYHVEGLGAQLFTRIDGDHFAIRGLPLLAVLDWLRQSGEMPT